MAWRPQPNDRFYRSVVRLGLMLQRLLGIRVLITGRQHLPVAGPRNGGSRRPVPGSGAVVAITHFGYLDFAFVEMMLWCHDRAQLRFLVHQGAADHWAVAPVISGGGHVVVPHGAGGPAYGAAVERLRAGEYIGILPEAGVSRSFRVRECRTGAVRMAADAGVPIIPVSVWGAHRLLTRGRGFSLVRAWRAPVRIHIGAPIPPGGLPAPAEDARAATDSLRDLLQAGIDAAMADFPLRPAPGAWWMPAVRGGGAPGEAERRRLDAADGPRRAKGPV